MSYANYLLLQLWNTYTWRWVATSWLVCVRFSMHSIDWVQNCGLARLSSAQHTAQHTVQRRNTLEQVKTLSITKIQCRGWQRKWLSWCAVCLTLPSHRLIRMCVCCCCSSRSLFLLLLLGWAVSLFKHFWVCYVRKHFKFSVVRIGFLFDVFWLGFSISLCLSIKSVGMQTR